MRALQVGRSMPALVSPNSSEIEIYDAGSAVSPINDRVVYLERTVGALSRRFVERKVA